MEPQVDADHLDMKSTDTISEDSLQYLQQKRVPEIMEYVLRSIIKEKPEEPLKFLHELAAQPLPPHIMIAGPPASGKGSQSHHICAYVKRKTGGSKGGRKPVHISSGDLLREEVEKGSNLGNIAQSYMKEGKLVPDSLIISMIRQRLQQEDAVTNGWLLDGFPRNKEQALALDVEGFAPDLFILLDCPDEVILERVEGRRVDPATNVTYHVKFNPPPEDDQALMDRLEQREDDTRDALIPRLEAYHTYLDAILEFYAPVAVRVDANLPEADVSNAITAILDERHLV